MVLFVPLCDIIHGGEFDGRKSEELNEQVTKLIQDIAAAIEQLEADRAKAIAEDEENEEKVKSLRQDVIISIEQLEKEQ